MFNPVPVGKRTRYSYAKIKEVMEMPHLLDIQRNSYKWFMQEGMREIFRDISPIQDFTENLVLSFEDFSLGRRLECINSRRSYQRRDCEVERGMLEFLHIRIERRARKCLRGGEGEFFGNITAGRVAEG